MGTSDTDRRSICTVRPFLASHHGMMDVRNECVNVCSIVLKLGNALMNIGYDGMGV